MFSSDFFEKDPKSPLFRLGLAENQRWVWRVWSIHLPSCWKVSTKARRPAVCLSGSSDTEGQRTWHPSGATALIRDLLHCIATSGMGAKGYLKQSQEPWGWTLSSCLCPSLHCFSGRAARPAENTNIHFYRDEYFSGADPKNCKTQNTQKVKGTSRPQKKIKIRKSQDLSKLLKGNKRNSAHKINTKAAFYGLYFPFVSAFQSLMLWVVPFNSSSFIMRKLCFLLYEILFFSESDFSQSPF